MCSGFVAFGLQGPAWKEREGDPCLPAGPISDGVGPFPTWHHVVERRTGISRPSERVNCTSNCVKPCGTPQVRPKSDPGQPSDSTRRRGKEGLSFSPSASGRQFWTGTWRDITETSTSPAENPATTIPSRPLPAVEDAYITAVCCSSMAGRTEGRHSPWTVGQLVAGPVRRRSGPQPNVTRNCATFSMKYGKQRNCEAHTRCPIAGYLQRDAVFLSCLKITSRSTCAMRP